MKGEEVMKGAQAQALYRVGLYLKRESPTILSIIGAFGVVATAISSANATFKACHELELNNVGNSTSDSIPEVVKTYWKYYIPPATFGAVTIICIFGSDMLSRRQKTALASALLLIRQSFKEYRNKLITIENPELDIAIQDAVIKDKYNEANVLVTGGEKVVFYEENRMEFFERTKEEVLLAEYHFNRNFALRGYACLNEFYDFLGLPKTKAGDVLGWSQEIGEIYYGYSWVDFEHRLINQDDGLECYVIDMIFPPTKDYLLSPEEMTES